MVHYQICSSTTSQQRRDEVISNHYLLSWFVSYLIGPIHLGNIKVYKLLDLMYRNSICYTYSTIAHVILLYNTFIITHLFNLFENHDMTRSFFKRI